MKILLLGFSKLKYMPYLHFYLDNIDTEKNEVHIAYWNRDLKEEDLGDYPNCRLHEFRMEQKNQAAKFLKSFSFFAYRRFAGKILKTGGFDLVFFLHTMPAVLFAGFAARHLRDRYVFDYRDYTYEAFPLFRRLVSKAVLNSRLTFISSDGFRAILPKTDKIMTSHNLLTDSLHHIGERQKNGVPSEKIRISFWGFIRGEELNKVLIRKIAADPRFELHYYGKGEQTGEKLEQYAKELGASNIFFHGEYRPEERYDFARKTDLIHNLYRSENTMMCMGNKYYDGAVFGIPQLCMRGSFMAKKAEEAGIGFACDPNDDTFTDDLFHYCETLDRDELAKHCLAETARIDGEYQAGGEIIREITDSKDLKKQETGPFF